MKTLLALISAFAMAFLPSAQLWAQGSTTAHAKQKKISSTVSGPKAVEMKPFLTSSWGSGSRVFKVGNKIYRVSVSKDAQGHVISKTTSGPDSREVLVDRNHTGTADYWELKKGRLTFRATEPYWGRFSKLEIEKEEPRGKVITKLLYNSDKNVYRTVASYIEPYHTMNAASVLVGEKCAANNRKNYGEFTSFLANIAEQGTKQTEKILACKLKAVKSALFDESCTSAKSQFTGSTDAMAEGLAQILASESTQGIGTSKSPRDLACVEKYRLGDSAAQAENFLQEKIEPIFNNLTPSEKSAIDDAVNHDCKLNNPDLEKRLSGKARNKLFKCDTIEADEADHRGQWDPNLSAHQITLTKTKEQMSHALSMSPKRGYASTILHESLHAGGITDESLTLNIEQCCASDDVDKIKQSSCDFVTLTTDNIEMSQNIGTYLALPIFKVQFSAVVDQLNHAMGPFNVTGQDQADRLKNEYQSSMSKMMKDDNVALDKTFAYTDGKKNPLCGSRNDCLEKKLAAKREAWKKYTAKFFNESCPKFFIGDKAVAAAKGICSKFEAQFEQVTDISPEKQKAAIHALNLAAAEHQAVIETAKASGAGAQVVIAAETNEIKLDIAKAEILKDPMDLVSQLNYHTQQTSQELNLFTHLDNGKFNSLGSGLSNIPGAANNFGLTSPTLNFNLQSADLLQQQAGNAYALKGLALKAPMSSFQADSPDAARDPIINGAPSVNITRSGTLFPADTQILVKPDPILVPSLITATAASIDFAAPTKPTETTFSFATETPAVVTNTQFFKGFSSANGDFNFGHNAKPADQLNLGASANSNLIKLDRVASIDSLTKYAKVSPIKIDGGFSQSDSMETVTASLGRSQKLIDDMSTSLDPFVKKVESNLSILPSAQADNPVVPNVPRTASTFTNKRPAEISNNSPVENNLPPPLDLPGTLIPNANAFAANPNAPQPVPFETITGASSPPDQPPLSGGSKANSTLGISQNFAPSQNNRTAARPVAASSASGSSGPSSFGGSSIAPSSAASNDDSNLESGQDGQSLPTGNVASASGSGQNVRGSNLSQKVGARAPAGDDTVSVRAKQKTFFRDTQDAQNYFELPYTKIRSSLYQPKLNTSLKTLRILVIDKNKQRHGCDPRRNSCQPTKIYEWCSGQKKLTPRGSC